MQFYKRLSDEDSCSRERLAVGTSLGHCNSLYPSECDMKSFNDMQRKPACAKGADGFEIVTDKSATLRDDFGSPAKKSSSCNDASYAKEFSDAAKVNWPYKAAVGRTTGGTHGLEFRKSLDPW